MPENLPHGSHDYIVGDVHGCADQLEELVAKVEEQDRTARFVFVGDLVDRGPDSKRVVEIVLQLERDGRGRAVLGNHDDFLLSALAWYRPDLFPAGSEQAIAAARTAYSDAPEQRLVLWLGQGGVETLQSYHLHPGDPSRYELPRAHVAFLMRLPLALTVGPAVVTHAWAPPDAIANALKFGSEAWRISESDRHELLWRRVRPEPQYLGLHVFGHTPREAPVIRNNAVNIDTACAYGGSLHAYRVSDGQLFDVPCV